VLVLVSRRFRRSAQIKDFCENLRDLREIFKTNRYPPR
jgi:hypothetical protein